MTTWLQDMEREDPKLANAYKIVGNQDKHTLRNMVKALTFMGVFNSKEEDQRLNAARYILKRR